MLNVTYKTVLKSVLRYTRAYIKKKSEYWDKNPRIISNFTGPNMYLNICRLFQLQVRKESAAIRPYAPKTMVF